MREYLALLDQFYQTLDLPQLDENQNLVRELALKPLHEKLNGLWGHLSQGERVNVRERQNLLYGRLIGGDVHA